MLDEAQKMAEDHYVEQSDDEPPVDERPDVDVQCDVDPLPNLNCGRPPAPRIDSAADDLTVMQVDVINPYRNTDVPAAIHLFGLTNAGNSVLVRVHNFFHYLFFLPPSPFSMSLEKFQCDLEAALRKELSISNDFKIIRSVEQVTKRSIMNYIPGDPKQQFFKITLNNPQHASKAESVLFNKWKRSQSSIGTREDIVFEASLDYVLRFMIEFDLVGCSWVTLPAGKYRIADNEAKTSLMQIEVDIDANDLVSHKPEGKWLSTAPLRRLSFDIECAGRKGVFPEAQHDSVIQIGNYVWEYGKDEPISKVIFTLNSCAPIVGADVLSYDDEKELLAAWSRFVRKVDPDIITGYNIVNFDLPYLMDRADALDVRSFPFLGRMSSLRTVKKTTKLSSSAFGTHDSHTFSTHGRVVFDMLQLIIREYRLRSYSLNSVSAEFLGQQKEDVHYSIINDLQKGDDQTRRRLAVYCLKDSLLPLKLMDKLLSLTNYIEMARVTGLPLGWLISRGHMVKVVSLLHRKAHAVNLLIPDGRRNAGEYEGATVIEPEKGFYEDPIVTLDFASLYPSIIMAHNLCYSTLVDKKHSDQIPAEFKSRTPMGAEFVKKDVKKGILTEMLEELLAARKQAKKELKEETDPFKKSVLNGRQLALKISANAVYGFTGAQMGKLPCNEISASTTAYGRQMIEKTKAEVERRFKGSRVIYGDTDSVMIDFGKGKSLEECMKLGEEAAEEISSVFPHPVKLEFEKCYYPYLLINKKRYAGLIWTNVEKFDKMDCKGIEAVRRDNCLLVANVISSVLELILKKRDLEEAKNLVKRTVSNLLQNRIDISLLVVSKALSKTDYVSKQAHVELAEKMKKRDAGTAPTLGDRVPYVITTGRKNEPAYSRAEDPLYVLDQNIPIDNMYYLENMLQKPLERIFHPVMGDKVSTLFKGDHSRAISVVTPKIGGMMKFTKASLRCLGCKTSIKSGAICKYCVDREADIYTTHLQAVVHLEKEYSSLWTECQRCMGELCRDVLCSNGDCPIFYRRRKAQKDLDNASAKLSRFNIDW